MRIPFVVTRVDPETLHPDTGESLVENRGLVLIVADGGPEDGPIHGSMELTFSASSPLLAGFSEGDSIVLDIAPQ